jgi:hypothetical protein
MSLHASPLSEVKNQCGVVRTVCAPPPINMYDSCRSLRTFAYMETLEPVAFLWMQLRQRCWRCFEVELEVWLLGRTVEVDATYFLVGWYGSPYKLEGDIQKNRNIVIIDKGNNQSVSLQQLYIIVILNDLFLVQFHEFYFS